MRIRYRWEKERENEKDRKKYIDAYKEWVYERVKENGWKIDVSVRSQYKTKEYKKFCKIVYNF